MRDASAGELAWVEKELDRLQASGAIAQVQNSAWVSKLFLVPKADKVSE